LPAFTTKHRNSLSPPSFSIVGVTIVAAPEAPAIACDSRTQIEMPITRTVAAPPSAGHDAGRWRRYARDPGERKSLLRGTRM
jgi:hypothetical protein